MFIAFGRLLTDPEDPEGLAQTAIEQACNQQNPGFPAFMFAALIAAKHNPDLAKRRLDQVLELFPDLTATSFKDFWGDPAWKSLMMVSTKEIEVLISLGLPEKN